MRAMIQIALLLLGCLTAIQGVWIDTSIPFNEGKFNEGKLDIDKLYIDGNTTEYTIYLKNIPQKADRLNIGFVVKHKDDGGEDGRESSHTQFFQFKVPESGNSTDAMIEQVRGLDYSSIIMSGWGNQNVFGYMTFGEYAQYLTLGSKKDKSLLDYGQQVYQVTEQFLSKDEMENDDQSQFILSFVVPNHEPIGENEIYLHWIFYDSKQVGNLNCTVFCFDMASLEGSFEPLIYYNLLSFQDYYDLDTIGYFYATLTAVSFIWIVGLPVQILMSMALQGYMFFMDVKNFLNVFKWGNRSELQNERLAIWYWFTDSFIFYNMGTYITTWTMLAFSLVPIIGPFCNIIITYIIIDLTKG